MKIFSWTLAILIIITLPLYVFFTSKGLGSGLDEKNASGDDNLNHVQAATNSTLITKDGRIEKINSNQITSTEKNKIKPGHFSAKNTLSDSMAITEQFMAEFNLGSFDLAHNIWQKHIRNCESCLRHISQKIKEGSLSQELEFELATRLISSGDYVGVQSVVSAILNAYQQNDYSRQESLLSALQMLDIEAAQAIVDLVAQSSIDYESIELNPELIEKFSKILANIPQSEEVGLSIATATQIYTDIDAQKRLQLLARQNAVTLLEMDNLNVETPANYFLDKLSHVNNSTIVPALNKLLDSPFYFDAEKIDLAFELGGAINNSETINSLVQYMIDPETLDENKKIAAIALFSSDSEDAHYALDKYLNVLKEENIQLAYSIEFLKKQVVLSVDDKEQKRD